MTDPKGKTEYSALHKCQHHYTTPPTGITWGWELVDRKEEQAASICKKQKCQLHLGGRQKVAENGKQTSQSQVTDVIVIEVPGQSRTLGFGREEPPKLSKEVLELGFPPNLPPATGGICSQEQFIGIIRQYKDTSHILQPEKCEWWLNNGLGIKEHLVIMWFFITCKSNHTI